MKKTLLILLALTFLCGTLMTQDLDIEWQLLYHETFDSLIQEPAAWTEDTYGDSSQWHVDIFDDDGEFFAYEYGDTFTTTLNSFRSFRKSFAYGENDWLTFELYGRDENKDGQPESGGTFINSEGKAKLICERHTDAGIIRPTKELPEIYRIQVTVSNFDFGGDQDNDGNWTEDGRFNGYDEDEYGDPWRQISGEWSEAWHENGFYYLCITDYPNPAPHNNVFIHHHRKFVMDTDNNNYDGSSWSYIYNPNTKKFEEDGSMYINMVWLNGENFGADFSGNHFVSWTPAGWQKAEWNTNFADKIRANETYVFTVERTPDYYTASISGNFYYGGETTYTATKYVKEFPVVWHYNRNESEDYDGSKDQLKAFAGEYYYTWPKDTYYPDYFFCGDPHINYYEGTAEIDDIKLWTGSSTGVEDYTNDKMAFQLSNYPNPFNSSTNIQFTVDQQTDVSLKIYNMLGQLVDSRSYESYTSGTHSILWNGYANITSGVYYAVLYFRTGHEVRTETIKMINMK